MRWLVALALTLALTASAQGIPNLVYLAGPYSPFPCKAPGVSVSSTPWPVRPSVDPVPDVGAGVDVFARWRDQQLVKLWTYQGDIEAYQLGQCAQPPSDLYMTLSLVAAQLNAGKAGDPAAAFALVQAIKLITAPVSAPIPLP